VFNQDNVMLVDIKNAPIESITETGVRTANAEYDFDIIVLATGFDAMTGPLMKLGIVGRDGLKLSDKWACGPRTYLGLAVSGFPNLFLITGPQSPSVLYNMPLAIEDHVDFVAEAITYMRDRGLDVIEATLESEDRWVADALEISSKTLLPGTDSWYVGANIPGKPRICMLYLGGAPAYRAICDDVVDNGYTGFTLERAAVPVF
jgi:cation diffusion facilitator CzcD-associated flavoprotein CzcO